MTQEWKSNYPSEAVSQSGAEKGTEQPERCPIESVCVHGDTRRRGIRGTNRDCEEQETHVVQQEPPAVRFPSECECWVIIRILRQQPPLKVTTISPPAGAQNQLLLLLLSMQI